MTEKGFWNGQKSLAKLDPEVHEAILAETEREKRSLVMIAGCEFVDKAERLAIDRVKRLFGSEHANVQPHSGSQANMAVYLAFLEPGDSIMGMDLSHGGHLTHGSPVSFSGKIFKPIF